jgi:hypothetical protein
MKTYIKITIHLSLFSLIVGAACTDAPVNAEGQSLLGRWQLHKVMINDSTILKPSPYTGRHEPELEFNEHSNLKGTTSANKISGSYNVNGQDSIKIEFGYETKIAENVWGRHFEKGVRLTKSYSVSGNVLELREEFGYTLFLKKIK